MHGVLRRASDLVLFATVVQAGSITQAANQLGLERTTVSRRLRDFEEQLDTKLLNRSSKRISVTQRGRLCYEHSLRILRAAKDADSAARGEKHYAPLLVGAPVLLIETILRPASTKFETLFPTVNVDFEVADRWTSELTDLVDIIVHIGHIPATNVNIASRKIGVVEQVIVASQLYKKRQDDSTDHHGHRWIAYPESQESIAVCLAGHDGDTEIDVFPSYRVSDASTARQAAIAGLGVCVLPRLACRESISKGDLVEVLEQLKALPVDISVTYRRSRELSDLALAFVDVLRDAAAETAAD
jgi:DNA-binding transcriptional LysR family regulator